KGIDASMFDGLVLEVAGNGEHYNVHLRTSELWLPWQSYRSDFITRSQWREIRLPFSEFEPYKSKKRFNPGKLVRIGVVAIGRQFDADLCLGKIAFYNDDSGD
ncbi:MAG: CIA30 family protein, partial [Gammaproteobacteria bacterium]